MTDRHEWSVAEARQRFSALLKAAGRAPQIILSRGRAVAAVIEIGALERLSEPLPTVGAAFEELRREAEAYELEVPPRQNRDDTFAEVADGAAGRYERSE